MKLRLLIASALLLPSLGCNKDAANSSNFEDALNHYYARLYTCTNYRVTSFPVTMTGVGDQQLDALTGVGLLTKASGAPTSSGAPQVVYNLTEKGRDTALKLDDPIDKAAPPLFCFGDARVDKVINFTQPAPDDGVQVSHVEYTLHLVHIPSWAKDPAVQKAFPNMTPIAFERRNPQDELLGLTGQGWRVARDR